MKDLRKLNKKRIDTVEMQKYLGIEDYLEFASIVKDLEGKKVISPVASSKGNGKRPALYNRYNILQEEIDYSKYIEELHYGLDIRLNKTYYLKNLEKYIEDRDYVLSLSRFLKKHPEGIETELAVNERSFQVWGKEKFLKKGGEKILKNVGLTLDFLKVYETTEPLPYYSFDKTTPQNVVIIENKDTFYSLRKFLLSGKNSIFGVNISTVIYGGGKTIFKSFKDFKLCVEPYLTHKENKILYLGDLDYEGILIYENLREAFKDEVNLEPFIEGYKEMIDKHLRENIDLPITKEGQNRGIKTLFLDYFQDEYKKEILKLLKMDKYIPQEILTIEDF